MLQDAALLTLDLLHDALSEDMTLKDASSYNIQWRGAQPLFIDVPSFELLTPGDAWAGYRQFCQLFLYPLMLQAYRGVPFQPWLRSVLDGIDPQEIAGCFGWRDCLKSGVLTHVLLHSRLQAQFGLSQRNVKKDLREAGFSKALIEANVRQLKNLVAQLTWRPRKITWADYASEHSYGDSEFDRKISFVEQTAAQEHRRLIWDLGGNTGIFSRKVARYADYTVVIDSDPGTIDHLYHTLKVEGNQRILPLCIDLVNPSPPQGWRCAERKSLIERGRPDYILVLALVHHMVIGANIPLTEFVDWLAELGGSVVVEFVTREDEMVQTLLRQRKDQYDDYHLDKFEQLLAARLTVSERMPLKAGKRVMFFAKPR
jgi:hypothetical protein